MVLGEPARGCPAYRHLLRQLGLGRGLARIIEWPGEYFINGRGLRKMLDFGTALARGVETLGAMLVFTPFNLIFFRSGKTVEPPESTFSRYPVPSARSSVDRSFAADLLCAGLGAAALLLFVTFAH